MGEIHTLNQRVRGSTSASHASVTRRHCSAHQRRPLASIHRSSALRQRAVSISPHPRSQRRPRRSWDLPRPRAHTCWSTSAERSFALLPLTQRLFGVIGGAVNTVREGGASRCRLPWKSGILRSPGKQRLPPRLGPCNREPDGVALAARIRARGRRVSLRHHRLRSLPARPERAVEGWGGGAPPGGYPPLPCRSEPITWGSTEVEAPLYRAGRGRALSSEGRTLFPRASTTFPAVAEGQQNVRARLWRPGLGNCCPGRVLPGYLVVYE
jgi:hypothetical protein